MIPKNDLIFSEDEDLPCEDRDRDKGSELSLMTLEIPS
jgi:hypothetical protein